MGARGGKQRILLRITPGVEAHTHSYIETGQVDSKFGFGLGEGWRWRPSGRRWRRRISTWWACTPTSAARSSSSTAFRKAIEILVKLIGQAHAGFGFECRYLNVGGGLGIRYTEEDTPSSIGDYAR